jgi:hypothetical protein
MQALCSDHHILIDFIIIILCELSRGHEGNRKRKRILNSVLSFLDIEAQFSHTVFKRRNIASIVVSHKVGKIRGNTKGKFN